MFNRTEIRALTRGAYDLQKMRIQCGLRLVANFKAKLGQAPSERETELDSKAQKMLNELRDEYDRITDAIADMRSKPMVYEGYALISDFSEYSIVQQYLQIEASEVQAFKNLSRVMDTHPLVRGFLKGVKGVGPAMSAVLISEVDIHKTPYASSLWALAGLDVGPDGKGRSMREAHLVTREYTDREGNIKEKRSITYNPFLKAKMVGVLGDCLLRAGANYGEIYRNYKHRLLSNPKYADHTPMHIHKMAKRYMVKMFLADAWAKWRELEGLPVTETYQAAKLGHTHNMHREGTTTGSV